ncbi:hypothetical protein ACH5RR_024342 [Cinchona calisaya]|uniref:Uncharacterized protein n=1 Tax=Cinchona calisaya TaxID=153742 RepID=A0ABD2YWD3_9GENT
MCYSGSIYLDKGLIGIREDDDINIMNEVCKGMPTRKIYVVAGPCSQKIMTPEGKIIYERECNIPALPWKDSGGNYELLDNQGTNIDNGPAVRTSHTDEDTFGVNSKTKSGLRGNENPEAGQNDEEPLEKHGSDAETKEYLDFNPEIEFRKSNFKLKVGQKFKNFVVFGEAPKKSQAQAQAHNAAANGGNLQGAGAIGDQSSQQPESPNSSNPNQVSQPTTNNGNLQDACAVGGQSIRQPEQPNCTNPNQVSQSTTNGGNSQGVAAVSGQSNQQHEQPNCTNPNQVSQPIASERSQQKNLMSRRNQPASIRNHQQPMTLKTSNILLEELGMQKGHWNQVLIWTIKLLLLLLLLLRYNQTKQLFLLC